MIPVHYAQTEARGMFLMLYIVPISFGMFKLNLRQMIEIAIVRGDAGHHQRSQRPEHIPAVL